VRRIHESWRVLLVAFLALVAAAGFRAAPGPLMPAMHDEFGWSMASLSLAMSVNLVLYGLMAPFATALMDRYGVRVVTGLSLVLVSTGSALTVFVNSSWQLLFTWGLLIGVGTGSMALGFAATIANRWFVRHRGLAMGILTAGGAAGQLVFLPLIAWVADHSGWRTSSLVVAGVTLLVLPLVVTQLRDTPQQRGAVPYGAPAGWVPPARPEGNPARRSIAALRVACRTRAFWALASAFAICGATTNGLVGIHFIPAAHDHGMAETTSAGLLAAVGIFDIAGTVASGWLTDRFDPRLLLLGYYAFRGVGLACLPVLLSDAIHPSMMVFIVIYGLDWVATVPPTVVLCQRAFGEMGTLVFGWVFAAHQVGAAVAAFGAGLLRDEAGTYTMAWLSGAALCMVAAALSVRVAGPAGGPAAGRDEELVARG
jgi:predicted MFS family arabinose efflux permease